MQRLVAMAADRRAFLDATAFDRMDFEFYRDPNGRPCAYCLVNDGEIQPPGWNLIGHICRWCLRDWNLMGAEFVYWRRRAAWKLAVLRPLTDVTRRVWQRQSCELILSGVVIPDLQKRIAEYAVSMHGDDPYSPRRRQATLWADLCRRRQAIMYDQRRPPRHPQNLHLPPHRRPPPHPLQIATTRYLQIGGPSDEENDVMSSSNETFPSSLDSD